MENAGLFWNLSSIEVKKRVQDVIFPEGLIYDFDKGFGSVKLANSYQLVAEIGHEKSVHLSMAPGTGLFHIFMQRARSRLLHAPLNIEPALLAIWFKSCFEIYKNGPQMWTAFIWLRGLDNAHQHS